MRFVYSSLMYLLTPYLLLRLWWKGRHLPAYRQRILERFCLDKQKNNRFDIWIHAVSLGEVIAATPLIEALLKKDCSIIITSMTPTGSERITTTFGSRVVHRYIPYDLPDVLRRFFKRQNPCIGIIMETELWPNLIYQSRTAGVPLFLANARLSERSMNGYMRFKWFFKPVLNCFTGILAQSPDDAQRFISLGASTSIVHVLGNIKFDLRTNSINSMPFTALKERWGSKRIVVIAASTHEDEELQIINQLRKLQQAIPDVILLIAPRHPERFQKVYQLCVQEGFNTALRTTEDSISNDNDIIVLNSLGELLGWYHVSDFAFVGGSFVPVGGHNVLEPIAMKVPVLSGRHVHNFKTICHDLQEAQAIRLVDGPEMLIQTIIDLYQDTDLKNRMVSNATEVLENNKGALEKHLLQIESVLTKNLQ